MRSCRAARARSNMSSRRSARFPPCSIIAVCSSRHSGWSAMMPRSRQMSAMTAPTGRRRISAAICSAVGRPARRGSASHGSRAARGARCALRACARRPGFRIRSGDTAQQPGFERSGAQEGQRDARHDQRDVPGAEAATGESGVIREAALPDCGGKLFAVVDELADQAEQTCEATAPVRACRPGGWLGGWTGCGGRGGHERNKNTSARRMSRKFFLSTAWSALQRRASRVPAVLANQPRISRGSK
jgi:hypothetical protein